MRTNGDKYIYEIQLSSITGSSNPACSGASICQRKANASTSVAKSEPPTKPDTTFKVILSTRVPHFASSEAH